MGKAMGAVVGVFSLGGVSMTLSTGWLGSFSECVALGVVGLGLMVSSHLLGVRVPGEATAGALRELKAS